MFIFVEGKKYQLRDLKLMTEDDKDELYGKVIDRIESMEEAYEKEDDHDTKHKISLKLNAFRVFRDALLDEDLADEERTDEEPLIKLTLEERVERIERIIIAALGAFNPTAVH